MLLRIIFFGTPAVGLLMSVDRYEAPVSSSTVSAEEVCALRDVEAPAYIGDKGCKVCHFKQHRSWKKTKMANAFESLKPGQKADIKEQHGLDPKKDYTKDPKCLACHTTGYGKPGGYPVVDGKKWTDKVAKLAADREGVQCESCHGPSSLMVDTKKEIKKSKREYTTAELAKLGLVLPDEKNCVECHNEKSPTWDPKKKFDFKTAAKAKGQIHDHLPLKQRKK